MAIQVTCPGCHTRFSVSDRFAGQKGPCPKCKKEIEIPKLDEQVEVHTPEEFGPKGKTGESVLKPVARQETKISPVQIASIVGGVVLTFGAALAVRFSDTDPESSTMLIMLGAGALVLGPLLSFLGYTFLRDQELAPFSGSELWMRVGICGALFAVLWFVFPIVSYTVGDYELLPVIIGVAAMVAAGGGIALAAFELDYLMGIVHYGMYFAICVGLRWIIGLQAIPLVTEG